MQLAICSELAVTGRKRVEDLVQLRPVLWCQRVEIDILQRSRDPSVVCSRVEVDHREPLLQEIDCGQETSPLDTVLVQLCWVSTMQCRV
jgi:hypothetical protein